MFTIGTVWKTLSNNYGKRFPPLLRVFSATPTVVNYSVGNGFNDAFPGNSSTQNELKIKKKIMCKKNCNYWATSCYPILFWTNFPGVITFIQNGSLRKSFLFCAKSDMCIRVCSFRVALYSMISPKGVCGHRYHTTPLEIGAYQA